MTSFFGLMLLGLFLGMRHATDPDHVIAVTTIVARQRSARGAAALGAAWGIGHTLTIMIVGGGIILFGWVIPPRVGLSTELSVGVMLIVLGVANLISAWRRAGDVVAQPAAPDAHAHAHAHGDFVHTHGHTHAPNAHSHAADATPVAWLDRHLGKVGAYRLVRPLLVGVVHGLAGSAAVALLVLATIKSPKWAMLYLLVFGVGTVFGMMLMTTLIMLPFSRSDANLVRLGSRLRFASGVISVAFGLFVAYKIGIVGGLFTGHPVWVPE